MEGKINIQSQAVSQDPVRTTETWTPVRFCVKSSPQFERQIEEHHGDYRAALGTQAINESRARGGAWTPSWDARERFDPREG